MIITLDNLATRYNCLPSQALADGTTFDLYVMDIATRWSNFQHEQAAGKSGTGRPAPRPSQETMLAMIKQVKGESHA